MALVYADRVKETASNKPNGATAFNLPDTGATGYRSFDSVLASTDTCIYGADNGTDWEVGLGTFTAGSPDTLTRTTILSSSTGSAIDWSAGGDVSVYITWSASKALIATNAAYVEVQNGVSNTQTLSGTAATDKLSTVFNSTVSDTNGWWDGTTNYRITPTRPGKYYVSASYQVGATTADVVSCEIWKNGAKSGLQSHTATGAYAIAIASGVVIADGDDYFEVYSYHTLSMTTLGDVAGRCKFTMIFLGE